MTGHTFRPMRSNRTRCDVCGRTAGVPTHKAPASTPAEKCPECGGTMQRTTIEGVDSWACPVDAYAYAVDQSDEEWDE